MSAEDRFLRLIDLLYEAPGSRAGWEAFLAALRIELHGAVANLICHDLESHRGSMMAVVGADAEGMRLYQEHWSAHDPWAYSPKRPQLGAGSVSIGDSLVSHAEVKRTAFYTDFGRQFDIVRMIGGVVEADASATSVISVTRPDRSSMFGAEDVKMLEHLMPHLQRALRLHRHLVAADCARRDLHDVLDSVPHAVFLLARDGGVILENRAATALLALADGLNVERGQLGAARPADTVRLRECVREAIQPSTTSAGSAGGIVTISRPSTRRPFICFVSPSRRQQNGNGPEATAAAMVFVSNPDATTMGSDDDLRELYGLTRAESALARRLAHGDSLDEAATVLGIRRHTVRSRLKDVFAKTHTNRQAELVRVLLLGAPLH